MSPLSLWRPARGNDQQISIFIELQTLVFCWALPLPAVYRAPHPPQQPPERGLQSRKPALLGGFDLSCLFASAKPQKFIKLFKKTEFSSVDRIFTCNTTTPKPSPCSWPERSENWNFLLQLREKACNFDTWISWRGKTKGPFLAFSILPSLNTYFVQSFSLYKRHHIKQLFKTQVVLLCSSGHL